MKRRVPNILFGLLCLAIFGILLLPPVQAEATSIASGTCGDQLTWILDSQGVLTISGTGKMTSAPWNEYTLRIRDIVIEDGVTSICSSAFEQCRVARSIQIGNTVEEIGGSAFYNCECLEAVEIPSSVRKVGASAFAKCTSLKEVELPSDTSWGSYAFSYCSSLERVEFAQGTTAVPAYIFTYCSNLKEAVLPEGITHVGEEAFSYSGLEKVTIPSTLKTIDDMAFYQCSRITEVHITDLSAWCNIDFTFSWSDGSNPLTWGNAGLYLNGERIEDLVIPSSITNIKKYAFYGCDSLVSITVPGTTTMGEGAFQLCDNLKEITFEEGTYMIPRKAFFRCASIKRLVLPASLAVVDENAFGTPEGPGWTPCNVDKVMYAGTEAQWKNVVILEGNDALLNVEIECVSTEGSTSEKPAVTTVASGTCGDQLTWILDSQGVLTISGTGKMTSAPWNEYTLRIRDIVIEDGVTSICSSAFEQCRVARSIQIGNTVEEIGGSAFYNCECLEAVEIPSSVRKVGASAFAKCTSLKEVELPSDTSWGSYAFSYCSSLERVEFAQGTTAVPAYIFTYCSNLKEAVLPEGITHVGEEAFSYSGLEKVTIPSTLKTIDDMAFYQCSRITEVHITDLSAWCNIDFTFSWSDGSNPLTWGNAGLYLNGERIEDLVIPSSITNIKKYAFYGCDSLVSITVPGTTTMGEGAFQLCDNLKEITFEEGTYMIPRKAFFRCASIKRLVLPASLAVVDENAFGTPEGPGWTPCNVDKVMYAGTEAQWKNVVILEGNDALLNAKMYYDFTGVIPGDFNSDWETTDADAVYLLRSTLFPEDYPSQMDMDVNSDGQVTDADAVYLLRHTLFLDQYPLYPQKER